MEGMVERRDSGKEGWWKGWWKGGVVERRGGGNGGKDRREGINIQYLALTRQLGGTESTFHVISHDERVASSCTFKLHPQELVRHAMVNVNQLVKGMSVP